MELKMGHVKERGRKDGGLLRGDILDAERIRSADLRNRANPQGLGVVNGVTLKQRIRFRERVEVPAISELLSPILEIVPLQLLAYHIAVRRGCAVDQPRNLAKSVTVE